MKKLLTVIAVILVSAMSFSQVASYGKLIYDTQYGFYFNNITSDGDDVIYIGKTVKDAINSVDELLGMCQLSGENVLTPYTDKQGATFIMIKQEIPTKPNGKREVRLVYARPYGLPGVCSWYILEGELFEILKMLSSWGK